MRRSSHLRSLSLRVGVLHPNTRIRRLTPWSVFQDGSLMTITPASLQMREPQSTARVLTQRAITLPEEPRSRSLYPPATNRCWPEPGRVHQRERWMISRAQVWSQALPFQQFHVLFNPLFKVLFIFRSLYLCAIGLWPIFSFRRHIPPI